MWDRRRHLQGVTIQREIDGELYEWRIPWNGLVPQAMAADLLGVSTMAVNKWVRSGKMKDIKLPGESSVIPLREVRRIRELLAGGNRLPPGCRGVTPWSAGTKRQMKAGEYGRAGLPQRGLDLAFTRTQPGSAAVRLKRAP